MKFRYYEVNFEDESTGDGFRVTFCPTLRDARKAAARVAEEERSEDEDMGLPEDPKSSATVQEVVLEGKPREIAAAALVAAGSSNEANWEGGEGRGRIMHGRRWYVTSRGRFVLEDTK